jgi:hypothetical protein
MWAQQPTRWRRHLAAGTAGTAPAIRLAQVTAPGTNLETRRGRFSTRSPFYSKYPLDDTEDFQQQGRRTTKEILIKPESSNHTNGR